MSDEPFVVGVLPTISSRESMRARAVACFNSQTYSGKRQLLEVRGESGIIGEVRNAANEEALRLGADVIVHFDDDDWSHPRRIEEQVALLVASGKEAVGYNEMWFYDERQSEPCAWLYSMQDPRYCLGTSLCYWAEVWKQRPFPNVARNEDDQWQGYLKRQAVSAGRIVDEARMIATIHGGNTSTAYRLEEMLKNPEWQYDPPNGFATVVLRKILEAR